jgi:hypothetical protein
VNIIPFLNSDPWISIDLKGSVWSSNVILEQSALKTHIGGGKLSRQVGNSVSRNWTHSQASAHLWCLAKLKCDSGKVINLPTSLVYRATSRTVNGRWAYNRRLNGI